MRRIVPILALLLLNACNMVVSRDPWFTRADEQGAPQLRPGLWTLSPDTDCKLDETKPVESWPDCAAPFVVRNQTFFDPRPGTQEDGTPATPEEADYVLTAANPLILQVSKCAEGATKDNAPPPKLYCYLGYKPRSTDSNGRLVQIAFWLILCGPTDPENPGLLSGYATKKPHRGLRVTGNNCEAESLNALKAAAMINEDESKKERDRVGDAHWVRDGDR